MWGDALHECAAAVGNRANADGLRFEKYSYFKLSLQKVVRYMRDNSLLSESVKNREAKLVPEVVNRPCVCTSWFFFGLS